MADATLSTTGAAIELCVVGCSAMPRPIPPLAACIYALVGESFVLLACHYPQRKGACIEAFSILGPSGGGVLKNLGCRRWADFDGLKYHPATQSLLMIAGDGVQHVWQKLLDGDGSARSQSQKKNKISRTSSVKISKPIFDGILLSDKGDALFACSLNTELHYIKNFGGEKGDPDQTFDFTTGRRSGKTEWWYSLCERNDGLIIAGGSKGFALYDKTTKGVLKTQPYDTGLENLSLLSDNRVVATTAKNRIVFCDADLAAEPTHLELVHACIPSSVVELPRCQTNFAPSLIAVSDFTNGLIRIIYTPPVGFSSGQRSSTLTKISLNSVQSLVVCPRSVAVTFLADGDGEECRSK